MATSKMKAHEKAEMAFMKKAKAPPSLMKGQKQEMAGMKCGGKVKYKSGGSIDGIAQRGKTRGKSC